MKRFINGLSSHKFITENWKLDDETMISDDLDTSVGAEVFGIVQYKSYHLE